MCGVNGIFAYGSSAPTIDRRELLATRDRMSVRGPDGAGEWWSADRRVALAHRRLAIIDLSENGAQPMLSADGTLAITFNGEIYNYPALRAGLEDEGVVFRTKSDTEVLLHLYRRDGPGFVPRLRGMYAFALWDEAERRLLLARDPYGIKPLYLSDDGRTVRFASSVKALVAGGSVDGTADPAGIVGFYCLGSVPEPFTTLRAVAALPAGSLQVFTPAGTAPPRWHSVIAAIFADGAAHPAAPGEVDTLVRAHTLESVRSHLLSDVEVGVFLSAGIDSGAILGLMRDAGQSRIRAITLAFEEFKGTHDDESTLAREVADLYGADQIVRVVGEREFREDAPKILEAMDQPSIDGINTWFIAKAAREAGLKVALSGIGGDELLCGYGSFRAVPGWVRRLAPVGQFSAAGVLSRSLARRSGLFARRPKAAGLLEYAHSLPGAYLLYRALFLPFELDLVLDRGTIAEGLDRLAVVDRLAALLDPAPRDPLSAVAALESGQYLRNQLLRDADWAGMGHSLEIRTPLVDIALLEGLASVTPRMVAGTRKRPLANAPSRPLPAGVTDRAKTGFGIPMGRWLARLVGEAACELGKGHVSRAWACHVAAGHGLGPGLGTAA